MNMKEPFIFDENEPISKALAKILEEGTVVFVTKNRRYVGLIDDKHLRTNIADTAKAKCGNFYVTSPVISKEDNTMDMVKIFLNGHFKGLPVIDGKKIIGCITRADVLNELLNSNAIPNLPVENVMSRDVVCIEADRRMADAKRLMRENNVQSIVVTKNGRLHGVISTYDFSAALLKPKRTIRYTYVIDFQKLDELVIEDMVRERIVRIKSESPLVDAANEMSKKNLSTAVVVSGEKPVGVVSANDIFRFVVSTQKEREEITITGLKEQVYYPLIVEKINQAFHSYRASLNIEDIHLKIKKGKRVYRFSLSFLSNRKMHNLWIDEYDVETGVGELEKELKRYLSRLKDLKKDRIKGKI